MVLIRPSILPGELDHGYIGRLARFNGMEDVNEVKILLAGWAGMSDLSPSNWSFPQILSSFSNVELTQFVGQHTTIPLFNGFRLHKKQIGTTSKNGPDIPDNRLSYTGGVCSLCDRCVEQDLQLHGQSYWRRDHQIPGLLWCPEHKSLLSRVYGPQWFNKPTAEAIGFAETIEPDWLQAGLSNPYIVRYVELAFKLMGHHSAFDTNATMHMLSNELVCCGFTMSANSYRFVQLFEDLESRFGHVWIELVTPFFSQRNGKFSYRHPPYVGCVEIEPSYCPSTVKYLTICALVYESAQQAFDALSQQ